MGGMPKARKPSKRNAGANKPRGAASGRASREDYYFSGGRRIRLERDSQIVGVLLQHPAVASSGLRATLRREGRQLQQGVVIVPWSSIPPERRGPWEDAGALLPVYAQDGALIVVLPEVRIEGTDANQVPAIKEWLKAAQREAEVVEERGTRMTLRPRSGRAAEALQIANEVEEHMHPALSQARFLRVVPAR